MWQPQLALHLYKELEKKTTKVKEDTLIIFEKYDGWYGYKQVGGDALISGDIKSRRQRKIPSLHDFSASMSEHELKNRMTLNGTLIFEILVEHVHKFKDLNGLLNRSKGTCECTDAYLMVHDFIPHNNSGMKFLHRYELAKEYVQTLQHSRVLIAPIIGVGNSVELQAKAHTVWNSIKLHDPLGNKLTPYEWQNEGVIGKRIDAPYREGKRNKDILKIKEEITLKLLVIGLLRGNTDGKYSNTVGKLLCKSKDGTIHNVSGMTDTERDTWKCTPELIIGKVVEVKAMKILPNGSLREGRYKTIRHDVTKGDID